MIMPWLIPIVLFAAADPNSLESPARVAVVQLPEVSDKYLRTADLEAHFGNVRTEFQQQRDGQKDRLDKMAKALQEELKPGTPEFRDRAKQITMAEAELKWFVDSEQQRIEEGLKLSLRLIFDDVQSAVHEIAAAKGIDIVIASDRMPEQNPESPGQLRQQILLQKVLYWSPRVDITADVIATLNTRYQTAPPPPPAVGTASPIGSAIAAPSDGKKKNDKPETPRTSKKP